MELRDRTLICLLFASLACTIVVGVVFVNPIVRDMKIKPGLCDMRSILWYQKTCSSTQRSYYTPNIQGKFYEGYTVSSNLSDITDIDVTYESLYYDLSIKTYSDVKTGVLFYDSKETNIDCSTLTSLIDSKRQLQKLFPDYIVTNETNTTQDLSMFNCYYYKDSKYPMALIYHEPTNPKIFIPVLVLCICLTILFGELIRVYGNEESWITYRLKGPLRVINRILMIILFCIQFIFWVVYYICWRCCVKSFEIEGRESKDYLNPYKFFVKGSIFIPLVPAFRSCLSKCRKSATKEEEFLGASTSSTQRNEAIASPVSLHSNESFKRRSASPPQPSPPTLERSYSPPTSTPPPTFPTYSPPAARYSPPAARYSPPAASYDCGGGDDLDGGYGGGYGYY